MAVQKFYSKITQNIDITPTVFELHLEPEEEFPFKAGQFMMLDVPNPVNPEKPLKRSYSIASPPESKTLELCIKLVENGVGTPYLKTLKPGERIKCAGSFGRFTYKTNPDRIPFFICTGTGIAPFYSMVRSQEFKDNLPKSSYCLLGVRNEEEILYAKQISEVPNMQWLTAVSCPTPSWTGFKGRVTDYIYNMPHDFPWQQTDFYLCGNGDMIKELKKFFLEEKQLDKSQLFQEIYF